MFSRLIYTEPDLPPYLLGWWMRSGSFGKSVREYATDQCKKEYYNGIGVITFDYPYDISDGNGYAEMDCCTPGCNYGIIPSVIL